MLPVAVHSVLYQISLFFFLLSALGDPGQQLGVDQLRKFPVRFGFICVYFESEDDGLMKLISVKGSEIV